MKPPPSRRGLFWFHGAARGHDPGNTAAVQVRGVPERLRPLVVGQFECRLPTQGCRSIERDELTPSAIAWAQAASTAGCPSVGTAARMATICFQRRSPQLGSQNCTPKHSAQGRLAGATRLRGRSLNVSPFVSPSDARSARPNPPKAQRTGRIVRPLHGARASLARRSGRWYRPRHADATHTGTAPGL